MYSSNFFTKKLEMQVFRSFVWCKSTLFVYQLKEERKEGENITAPTDMYKHQNTGKNKLRKMPSPLSNAIR